MCGPFRKAYGVRRAVAFARRRGFPCAVRSAKGVRFSLRYRFSKAAGSRRAAPPKRRAFRARPVSQGGGFPARGSPKRRAFRARSVPQGGGFPSCGHHAGRLALAAPAGGAAPPFSPLPAPRRRYTRRVPTCRTGTPTARSRDKASGSACPRCGRRGNIGPVPRRSTSFSPPPWALGRRVP